MILIAYLAYAVLVSVAALRWWGRVTGTFGVAWLVAMLVLPVVGAVALTLAFTSSLGDDRTFTRVVLGGLFVAGALLFLCGIAVRRPEKDFGVPFRTLGWCLLAAPTLIPATIALLAPFAGLLALFVPPRSPDRSARPVTPETSVRA